MGPSLGAGAAEGSGGWGRPGSGEGPAVSPVVPIKLLSSWSVTGLDPGFPGQLLQALGERFPIPVPHSLSS